MVVNINQNSKYGIWGLSIRKVLLLFFVSFWLITGFVNAQVNQHLTTYNGLSNNSITYIFKDSRGFIWIGTTDGLNRYDGNSFVVFKHNPTDVNSISDNFISSIIEDVHGNIWIGTQGSGLNMFNPVSEKFTSYYHSETNISYYFKRIVNIKRRSIVN